MNTRNLFITLFTALLYCTSFESVAQNKTEEGSQRTRDKNN